MVVEHVFVTTREEPEVMHRAALALGAMGFAAAEGAQPGGPVYRRGKKSAAKARRPSDLPQAAAIQFDRGRVTLAASMELLHKPSPTHKELLVALANAVERAVQSPADGTDVLAAWREVSERLDREARRRRHRLIFIMGVTIAACGLVLAVAIASL